MPSLRISPIAAISALCLGLSMFSLAAAPARAQDDQEEDTIVLSTRGIDLASAPGQAGMMRRIDRAAREVCDEGDRATSEERVLFKECHDEAVADASRQMQVLVARAGGGALLAEAGKMPR